MDMKEKLINLVVDEYTSPCALTVEESASMPEVLEIMAREKIRHLPVVDSQNQVAGILSERDVKSFNGKPWSQDLKACDMMTANPYTVRAGTPLEQVAFEMSKNKYGSALVRDEEGNVTGIFTATDALNALIEILRGEV